MDWLHWRLPFIITTIAGWILYVFIEEKRHPGRMKSWGFRLDNFIATVKLVLPFAVASVFIFLMTGMYLSRLNLNWHILPIMVLYPLWGTIQQFLLIGIVVGNLQGLQGSSVRTSGIVISSALLFGSLHYPYYWLMIGTFMLALFYGRIYIQQRNLFVLGLFHGWLAALFFYTVVDRDPFLEVFGNFLD
jgi:hypothetical protein